MIHPLNIVMMTKYARPEGVGTGPEGDIPPAAAAGVVKSRLIPALGRDGAVAVHRAMLRCILRRLEGCFADNQRFQLHLAFNVERGHLARAAADAGAGPHWRLLEQGEGDLGARLERVWREVGGGAVLFLGVDSPDVPMEAVASARPALEEADVAIGPVPDGGYWTLAARRLEPRLLQGIDWGTASVYHQTVSAGRAAGLRVVQLASWYDVDELADLAALSRRLEGATEPALADLRQELARIVPADQRERRS